ncbi:MAG: hypothetical protein J6K14_05955 [Clostridia bacterium]|nr:hypothetical protein [Clostridia bacterium]
MKKRRFFACFLLVFVISSVFSIVASADTGPKPSVRITLLDLPEGEVYATLLSKEKRNGPHAAWDGTEEDALHNGTYGYGTPYAIWEAFVTYEDADGYYFLQLTEQRVEENGQCSWGYYPPEEFKLLLYFPESDTYLVSEPEERYAFHSYFTVHVGGSDPLVMVRSYDYAMELVGLVFRIVITLAVELLLAFLFFMKEKRLLVPIIGFNVITQILLNLLLAGTYYKNGSLAFVIRYVGCELLVTAIEAVLLFCFAPRLSKRENVRRRAVIYAVLANAASLLIGYWLSFYIPTIF